MELIPTSSRDQILPIASQICIPGYCVGSMRLTAVRVFTPWKLANAADLGYMHMCVCVCVCVFLSRELVEKVVIGAPGWLSVERLTLDFGSGHDPGSWDQAPWWALC